MRPGASVSEEGNRTVALRVVERTASTKGVNCDELTPISEVVDSDALTELASSLTTGEKIVFEYEGFTVTVRGEGQIRLSRLS